ncbi:MAG: deoxyguanosinetriphosphate triphosphohydrolase [Clostridiales bacterium]|nr:deoxyguanosinetriphosphate triphosphohydrolase [Clostridiales bacterium]
MIDDISKVKDWFEKRERETLSKYAVLSQNTKGRLKAIQPCPLRLEFNRDRDRIIHCKSFRRLKHKTQVFFAPVGDHYRTRLTHTLEVTQIARSISRGLLLNEDLTEAIALGHDLGHTPFGHAGETQLNELVPTGFEHNKQSLRMVDKLENRGLGLNLTYEVRDGILNHRSEDKRLTLEASVVSLSDKFAYVNHDIDDAVRAGILKESDIPKSCLEVLGKTHGERINTLIIDVIKTSFNEPMIGMSDIISREFGILRNFMFEYVYLNKQARREEGKAKHIVAALYKYYKVNNHLMPLEFTQFIDEDGIDIVTADYIACMTDRYAINDFMKLFIPHDV